MKLNLETLELAIAVQSVINTLVDSFNTQGLEWTVEQMRQHYRQDIPKAELNAIDGMFCGCKILRNMMRDTPHKI